jgi:hypothetical protein
MMAGIHEYNKTGQIKRPSYKDIVTWIAESWAAVSENCVTLSEINSDEVPKEILTALDSFNVESDEEFLGFE